MELRTSEFAESLLKDLGFDENNTKPGGVMDFYGKRNYISHALDDYVKKYRERLIENYSAGDWGHGEKYGGCEVMEVGEGDGLVIITKSLRQAVKAFRAYWKETAGEPETPEHKGEDFGHVRVWLYKRPECEGDEVESYFDFTSKHPKAKSGFLIYY